MAFRDLAIPMVTQAIMRGLTDRAPSFGAFRSGAAETATPSNPVTVGRADRLSSLLSRPDPVMAFSWIGMVMDRSNPKALEWYYIDAIQTPGLHFEDRPVFREGKVQHYPTAFSVDNLTLTLYTDTAGTSFKFVSSWLNAVLDVRNGNWRLPVDYKKDIYVYLLDPVNGTVCQMKFIGCAPSVWSSYSLDGSSSTPLATTLELTVDRFYIQADDGANNINNQLDALARNEDPVDQLLPIRQAQQMVSKFADLRNAATLIGGGF